MTTTPTKPYDDDQDAHKGAVEGDKPDDKATGNPAGSGIDKQGLPNNPVATAQDKIGANDDESQG
jgi:hypothetical protein